MAEAALEDGVPVTAGWFVVNARDARWLHNRMRSVCRFGGEGEAHFDDLGVSLYWLEPGRPMSLYHHEAGQEDFLVLAGRCTLVIEGQTRPLEAWDLVHCPPRTAHTIVAAGDRPALVFAVGARKEKGSARYPVDPTAISYGAGVPDESTTADQTYASFGDPTPGAAPAIFSAHRDALGEAAAIATDGEVETAGPEDVRTLAGCLADAFFDDPVMVWLLPDAAMRRERLRRFFVLELRLVGLARGSVWTTKRRDGAAIVTPPGQWSLPWSVALRHGPHFTRAFGTRLPVATGLLQMMEHRHLRERHYYIPYIGVAPSAQGRGLGTRLMAPTLTRCDELGLPAYLEATCPRNIALYERLGFVGLDELRFAGSPPLLLMRRPAAVV